MVGVDARCRPRDAAAPAADFFGWHCPGLRTRYGHGLRGTHASSSSRGYHRAMSPLASLLTLAPLSALPSLSSLFPNGIAHYAVGGVLVGLGVVVIYVATGLIPGASTFLESTWSYVSGLSRFNRPSYLASRDWRVVFTVGIVLGAAVYSLAVGEFGWTTDVQPWRLFAGGILIGVGTRVGKGCTSGHGVCGMASRSPASIVNVVIFVLVAMVVAAVVGAAGVVP